MFLQQQVITLEPAKSSHSRNYVVLEDHLEDIVSSSSRLRQPIEDALSREHAGKPNCQGQWFGSVGKAVASDTRGPQFKSSHQQNLY